MSLAALSLRLARVRLGPTVNALPTWKGAGSLISQTQQLRFKTNKKQKSNSKSKLTGEEDKSTLESNLVSSPHDDWVKFQQAIAVDGFETGQTTKTVSTSQKRGGKIARRRREKELAAIREREARAKETGGGGQFPAMRFSDEETERLLAEAYANKPVKGGSKKTRHKKREYLRWFLVRKARAKQKQFKIQAHFRKMEKRSKRVKSVLAVKAEGPAICERDAAYQKEVLRKWALTMLQGQGDEKSKDKHATQPEQIRVQDRI